MKWQFNKYMWLLRKFSGYPLALNMSLIKLTIETMAQCNVFFDYMNRPHPNIRFTKEVEQDQSLSFLDIKIQRCEDGTLATTVNLLSQAFIYNGLVTYLNNLKLV